MANSLTWVLFLDTETNGLCQGHDPMPHDHHLWPRLIQIAWQLRVYNPVEWLPLSVQKEQYIVKPDAETVWDAGAEAVHKISRVQAEAAGIPLEDVLGAFWEAIERADAVVAHNVQFDQKVIEAELFRIGAWKRRRWPINMFCTKLASTSLCKLPGGFRGQYKYPRLEELYFYLYRKQGGFAYHSAQGDVDCLVACFDRMRHINHIAFCPCFIDVQSRAKRATMAIIEQAEQT